MWAFLYVDALHVYWVHGVLVACARCADPFHEIARALGRVSVLDCLLVSVPGHDRGRVHRCEMVLYPQW